LKREKEENRQQKKREGILKEEKEQLRQINKIQREDN
jgi:hypothetical protein